MSNNDLKKLTRLQLLEMLLMQTQRVEELEAELKEKDLLLAEQKKNVEVQQKRSEVQLKDFEQKKITFSDIGTRTEAVAEISNIFQLAEKAAAQYLDNVKYFTEVIESNALDRSLAAKKEAESIIKQAKEERRRILQQANRGINEKI